MPHRLVWGEKLEEAADLTASAQQTATKHRRANHHGTLLYRTDTDGRWKYPSGHLHAVFHVGAFVAPRHERHLVGTHAGQHRGSWSAAMMMVNDDVNDDDVCMCV
eukprot:2170442-Rhodomonas_salina.1